jgi:OOP family OmpA-OmpF porin
MSSPYSTTPWDNRSPYVLGSINGMDPDDKFNSGHGEGVGLRVGKAVSDHWDVQLGATYDRDNDNHVNYMQNTLGADALYMFSRDRFKPFLEAGLGAEFDRVSTPAVGTESRASPYVDVGLGFQYQISDQWAAQVDYRRSHAWLRSSAFDFDKVNDGILSVGVAYYFGKPRMAPPPLAAVTPPPPPPSATTPAPAAPTSEIPALYALGNGTVRL